MVLNLKLDGVFEMSFCWFIFCGADCGGGWTGGVCERLDEREVVGVTVATVVDAVTVSDCGLEICPARVTTREGATDRGDERAVVWLLPILLFSSWDNAASEQLPPLFTRLRLKKKQKIQQ